MQTLTQSQTREQQIEIRIRNHNPDVIGFTEINIKNATHGQISEKEVQFEGYDAYVNLKGRGTVLYIKEHLISVNLQLNAVDDSSIWGEIPLKNKDKLIVGVVYRSPNSSDEDNGHIMDMIGEVSAMNSSHLLILGDFNLPEIDWSNQSAEGPLSHPSNSFLECIRDCFLYQHVTEPTHYRGTQRPSVIDLIITNEENMIQDLVYNDPIGKSHHVTLNWQLSCYSDVESCSAMKHCYQKGNYADMRRILGEVNWSGCLTNGTVDEMWVCISDHLLRAVEMCVPLNAL